MPRKTSKTVSPPASSGNDLSPGPQRPRRWQSGDTSLYRALIENSLEMMFLTSKEGAIEFASPACTTNLGYALKELIGRSIASFAHPDDASTAALKFAAALQEPGRRHAIEVRIRAKDGSWQWLEGLWSNLLASPSVGAMLLNLRDVTDRKQAGVERSRAEESLRQEQRENENYRSLVHNAPYGICRVDPYGRLFKVNPALVEMLAYGEERALLDANLYADIFRSFEPRALTPKNGEILDGVEATWYRRNGTPIQVRLSGRPVGDPEWPGTCYELIVENVTEQRALEKQFRQAQKMEAVGRLAGGVAHDFNNLLTVIKGQIELLMDHGGIDPWFRQRAEQIEKAADRAAALTRQLLAFSRMQVLQTKVIDLCEIVADMGKMLPRLIGENIELEIAARNRSARVKADPGQMEQVILNLAVNARDAMPHGGRLRIETGEVDLDEAFARHHPPVKPGRYVALTVADTGVGIDLETQAHIFEPFFTTKEVGKGTGLGLATVYGVIKQSGGYIWVVSEKGRGATFQVYLPQVMESPSPLSEPDSRDEIPAGTETVLIAEDDKEVREIAREFLGRSGYIVLEARDGAEALRLIEAHSGAVHVVITDLIMPNIGGRELAERIATLSPETKVIYMSGYAEFGAGAKDDLEKNAGWLTKPFSRAAIVRAVAEALHAPQPQ